METLLKNLELLARAKDTAQLSMGDSKGTITIRNFGKKCCSALGGEYYKFEVTYKERGK